MPTKLKILIGLLLFSLVGNLLTLNFLAAFFGALMTVGVFKGSEGTRTILRILAFISLAVTCFGLLTSLGSLKHVGPIGAVLLLGLGGIAILHSAFMIWCLGQPDVQDWMYKRGLPESLRNL